MGRSMTLRVPAFSNRYHLRKPLNGILFGTSNVVVNRKEERCYVVNTTGSTILDPNAALQQPESLHDPYILNKVISSCAEMGWLSTGVQLHCNAVKLGFHSNVYINTSLIDTYGKCDEILLARTLFEEMPTRNAVTWNALLSGCVKAYDPVTAIELLIKMLERMLP